VTRPLVDVVLVLVDGTRIPVDVVYTGRNPAGAWEWKVTTDLGPIRRKVAGAHVELGPAVWEQTARDLGIQP
jgi:hypothetical protein